MLASSSSHVRMSVTIRAGPRTSPGPDVVHESAYSRASALRRLNTPLGQELAGSGLSNPFLMPVALADAESAVLARLQTLADQLNTDAAEGG